MSNKVRKYQPGEYRPFNSQSKNLAGMTFGHWDVIEYDDHPNTTAPGPFWWCKCQYCGKIKSVSGRALTGGKTDHCGCQRSKNNGIRQFKDLTNQRFGRLVVLEFDHMRKTNHGTTAMWKCQCDCGAVIVADGANLRRGDTRSCGCFAREAHSNSGKITTHGDSNTRLYHIYHGMVERCYNTKKESYAKYGAKGIRVCSEWYDPDLRGVDKYRAGNPGWLAFKKWAYAPISEGGGGYYDQPKDTPYMDLLSIDRRRYKQDYSPDNCWFIPMRLQAKNRSNNVYFFDGELFDTSASICARYDVPDYKIAKRRSTGWTPNAIVHDLKHPELGLHKTATGYRDKDGYLVMIPNYHASFISNPGDEEGP